MGLAFLLAILRFKVDQLELADVQYYIRDGLLLHQVVEPVVDAFQKSICLIVGNVNKLSVIDEHVVLRAAVLKQLQTKFRSFLFYFICFVCFWR